MLTKFASCLDPLHCKQPCNCLFIHKTVNVSGLGLGTCQLPTYICKLKNKTLLYSHVTNPLHQDKPLKILYYLFFFSNRKWPLPFHSKFTIECQKSKYYIQKRAKVTAPTYYYCSFKENYYCINGTIKKT